MARRSGVYWLAPVIMGSALLAALVCAFGHHLFYSSLAGTLAPIGQYSIAGTELSRQQLNTAVGSAFGFIVKSLLTITIATAFVQAFWRALRTSMKGPTLGSLDSTFSVLSNVFGLFNFRAWGVFPVPLLLAVIAWVVPIASIVTPATLSVQAEPVSPPLSQMRTVPKLDFSSLNFANPIPMGDHGYCFNGPSQSVERVAVAVAAQGEVLAIPAPGPNVTWTVDFEAPSLSCSDAGTRENNTLWDHILEQWGYTSDCSYTYGYMAWVSTPNGSFPFIQPRNESGPVLQNATLTYGAPASIYVATMPQMFNYAFLSSDHFLGESCKFYGADSFIYTYPIAQDICLAGMQPPECYGQQAWITNGTLLKCDLMNTTYHATFEYRDGQQNISVAAGESHSTSAVTPQECVDSDTDLDDEYAKLLSYQAISSAFNQLILGSVTMSGTGKLPGLQYDTNIASTILMETDDLAFIIESHGINQTYRFLQTNKTNAFPSRRDTQVGRRGDLKTALEELFQNITISLLANEMLRPNYSSPYAPSEKTEVTFNTFHNVYIYSASTLWVAYGLAICMTTLAMGLGIWSMLLNNGSFTNDFSTVLRTSRTVELSEDLLEEDRDGRQPLPKRLGKARIRLDVLADKSSGHSSTSAIEAKEPPTAETSLLPLRRDVSATSQSW